MALTPSNPMRLSGDGSGVHPEGYPIVQQVLAPTKHEPPAAPSVALANAQANGIMQTIVYPDAYHSFDAASGIEKPHIA